MQVDRRCPKCGHEGMVYTTWQTRSADEGQTVFYTCLSCGYCKLQCTNLLSLFTASVTCVTDSSTVLNISAKSLKFTSRISLN